MTIVGDERVHSECELRELVLRARAARTIPPRARWSTSVSGQVDDSDPDLWLLHVRYRFDRRPEDRNAIVERYAPIAATLARRLHREKGVDRRPASGGNGRSVDRDRSIRHRPARSVPRLRRTDDRRPAEAVLPRLGLGVARSSRGPRARTDARRHSDPARPRPRPVAHEDRARQGRRHRTARCRRSSSPHLRGIHGHSTIRRPRTVRPGTFRTTRTTCSGWRPASRSGARWNSCRRPTAGSSRSTSTKEWHKRRSPSGADAARCRCPASCARAERASLAPARRRLMAPGLFRSGTHG